MNKIDMADPERLMAADFLKQRFACSGNCNTGKGVKQMVAAISRPGLSRISG
ncbi:MAG: hypothetical protein ACLR2G_06800 [Phascolarctobacterium faecium]